MSPIEDSAFGDAERVGARSVSKARGTAFLALLSFAIVVLSLAASSASAGVATKPVLRIGIVTDPNPDPAKDTGDPIVRCLAYASLIHAEPDGTLTPDLALSWHYISTNRGSNKGFELTLRHNVRFSNGQVVTAQAVANWLTYYTHAGGYFAALLGPNPIFQASGKWTVRILLTVPNGNLPGILSDRGRGGGLNWGFVAAPAAVANPKLFATGSYGAGPYMLDPNRSVTGNHYTYVPNPSYWDKTAVRFREVDVKVITTPSSMLQAIESGQLDVAQGDPATATAAAAAHLNVVSSPDGGATMLFNFDWKGMTNRAMGDVRVRQALNYAIDRKTIVSALSGKYGIVTSEPITTDGFDPSYQDYYAYNPQKAKALLAAAGYARGLTVNVLDEGFVADGDPYVQAVAKYEDAVGIHFNITTAADLGSWFNDLLSKQYSLVEANLTGLAGAFYTTIFAPKTAANVFGNDDRMLDKLYYASLKAKDPATDVRLLMRRVTTQAYTIPLVGLTNIYYVSNHIGAVATSLNDNGYVLATDWSPK